MKVENNMEINLWESVKAGVNWFLIPIVIAAWYFIKHHILMIKEIEKQGFQNTADIKVLQVQGVKFEKDLDEIKQGINKLLERSIK